MKHTALYISVFTSLFAGIFTGCKPATVKNSVKNNSLVLNQSYVVVNCDTCKIVYQTADKKEEVTVTGISPKLIYHYSKGKTLKANIYALNGDQDIIYTVYNQDGRIIYDNTLNQATGEPWDVNVLL